MIQFRTHRLRLVIVVLAIALILFATLDYVRFERALDKIPQVSDQIGGRAGSIGGWPFGVEYAISFDRPITKEELQRLVAVVPDSRFHLSLGFNCDVPDQRLAELQQTASPRHIGIVVSRPQ